ncbi:MAG: 4-phosphopantetheinyl transferase superfamily protein [Rhodoferax sp.]|nr:4-phosphopantetheinyl transferase superfamily protein [Rhodoferax sp.]
MAVPAPQVFMALGCVGPLAAAAPPDLGWLSDPEAGRLAAMSAPSRRAQFIGARWLLRRVLAIAYGGDPATDWPLSAADDAPPKPLQTPSGPPLHLSLSHSVDHVCCAASTVSVGVDIETLHRPRNWLGLADLVCTPGEARRVQAATEADRAAAFYAMWTLKEAWIKCHGAALSPALLARLETEPLRSDAVPETANARLWRDPAFVMALVAPVDAEVVWTDAVLQPVVSAAPWRIQERPPQA